MKRIFATGMLVSVVGAVALVGAAVPSDASDRVGRERGDRLGRLINERLHADGPFFTARTSGLSTRRPLVQMKTSSCMLAWKPSQLPRS